MIVCFLYSTTSNDTPVTQVQNFLQATTLHDLSLHSEETLTSEESSQSVSSQVKEPSPSVQLWRDIDQAEAKDPLFSSEYAPDIYAYMRQREVHVVCS